MTVTEGLVIPAGGGKHFPSSEPGRNFYLKLLSQQTAGSVMLFEETLPAGTKSLFHRHRDSDEIAWVLEGEFSFMIGDRVSTGGPGTCVFFPRHLPHAWKNSGSTIGRAVFLYTPAAAGHYVEELFERSGDRLSDAEREMRRKHHNWEVLGPNPL